MGMAHKAPMDRYTRTHNISDNAIEHMMELLPPSANHRGKKDLGHLIDSTITENFGDHRKMKTRYGETVWVVSLTPYFEGIFALVKADHVPGRKYVPDVIDDRGLNHKMSSGELTDVAPHGMGKLGDALGSKLAQLREEIADNRSLVAPAVPVSPPQQEHQEPPKDAPPTGAQPIAFLCPNCPRSFETAQGLALHKTRIHTHKSASDTQEPALRRRRVARKPVETTPTVDPNEVRLVTYEYKNEIRAIRCKMADINTEILKIIIEMGVKPDKFDIWGHKGKISLEIKL